jgi:hypothetical protein
VWGLSQRILEPGVKEILTEIGERDPDPRVAQAAKWALMRKRPTPRHQRENAMRQQAFERAAERAAAVA